MIVEEVKDRRVFINKNDNYFQLFSFSQNKDDGSIYCSMPEFGEVKWMSIVENVGKTGLIITNPLADKGKLSMHGSGMVTYRAHANKKGHQLIVKGNHLLNKDKGQVGIRHLFSSYFQEPQFMPPNSPAFNRESDYAIKTDQLKPFVLIFFAVPSKPISVNISTDFHADDLESIPPEFSFGQFSLSYHNIVWFYYRTKHMDRWPKHTHVCYHDGYRVPMFIGQSQNTQTKEASCRLEFRYPTYKFEDNLLSISLSQLT